MFATSPITYATAVMIDPLVLRYKEDEMLLQVFRRFLKLAPARQEEVLKLHVHQDGLRNTVTAARSIMREEHSDLASKQLKLKDILDCNACSFGVAEPGYMGLFLHTSRLNHSCVPNAEGYYDRKSGHMYIRALTDIGAHEEITISYIYHILPRAKRQELLSNWRFVCRCPACNICHPSSAAHEKRRSSLSTLQLDLLQCTDSSGSISPTALRSRHTLEIAARKTKKISDLLTQDPSLRRFSWQMYLNAIRNFGIDVLTVPAGTSWALTLLSRSTG